MPKESEIVSYMYTLPTELLLNIFIYLPAKELTKCRQVCLRWKLTIDSLTRSDDLWRKFCEIDFCNVCKDARKKAKPDLLWYNLYRTLSLWARLGECREETDEFSSASSINEEIKDFQILGNGILGVHKKCSIEYYNLETLEPSKRSSITGDYSRYIENDYVIVIMSYHLHLFVIRKLLHHSLQQTNTTFDNVKLFLLTDADLYYVTLEDEIYVCELMRDSLTARFVQHSEDGIMALGYTDNCLHFITFRRNIYSLVNDEIVYECSLGPESNLLHQMHRYDFLDQLDWRVYFQWMYVLNHSIPEGPLRDIITIRPYGDVYFVGSNWGVLRIYYAPYCAGEFDIFKTQPVKQYNFMERSDCPVLSTCPILQIDVFESEDKHTVIVAMPKKIAVIHFTHDFKRSASSAMLPYNEVQKVKLLKTDNSI